MEIPTKFETKIMARLLNRLGADQGISTCLTLSDGQITNECHHGHTLTSIIKKIARKRKGSKAFKQASDHRTNYINWSVKQLNLGGVSEVNYEKIRNLGSGQRKSRFLQGFSYREIKTAMAKHCFLTGVHFKEQDNVYRSQRCSHCGYVHKLNRKGKVFKCRHCGEAIDADLNAAKNHADVLWVLPFDLRIKKLNLVGFFWKINGIYDLDGVDFADRLNIESPSDVCDVWNTQI